MNQSDLESILKKARLPEIGGESLEMFPRLVVARLKRNDQPVRDPRQVSPRQAWAVGLAACFVIAIAIGHRHRLVESKPILGNDSLASVKLIRETLSMFPNRVRAIVQDENGLNLVLSENDDMPASTPIYVRICDGKTCSSFVTFSGQEIRVADQKMTVLADGRGDIILTGDQFVWSITEQTDAGKHLKIEARNLGTTAM